MDTNYTISTESFLSILPEMIIFGMGMILILLDLFRRPNSSLRGFAWLTLLVFAVAGYAVAFLFNRQLSGFNEVITADNYALIFKGIFLVIMVLTTLFSIRNLENKSLQNGEFYPLLLFCCGGMMLMVSTSDLLLMFIGLEILSISSYILCGLARDSQHSTESALKYFLLGAFASAFLLYGMALLYGVSGSLHLADIHRALEDSGNNPIAKIAIGLILIGFAFKLSLVPFHMWTPDVYEGAPTSITAFLSAGPKAASIAALGRVLLEGVGTTYTHWDSILWVLAALSMTVGNVLALQQNNIKRMLAYSSIAHAGYLAVTLVIGTQQAISGMVFYALAYALMNSGAFAILILASSPTKERTEFKDYLGFGYSNPVLGLAMFIFMLSLAGIPLTAGFVGKFQIFKAAIESGYLWLTVIGVLNSVVSIYYYLRIVVMMYMQPPPDNAPSAVIATRCIPSTLSIGIALLGVVYLGIFPSSFIVLSLFSTQFFGF